MKNTKTIFLAALALALILILAACASGGGFDAPSDGDPAVTTPGGVQTDTGAGGIVDSAPGHVTDPVTEPAAEPVTGPATEPVTEEPVVSSEPPVTDAPDVPDVPDVPAEFTVDGVSALSPFSLAVIGDISFADNWEVMQNAAAKGYGVDDFIGASLLDVMRSADLFMVNNEFCFSDRGEPLTGKYYTFRAAASNVDYLLDIGADIACLANNHVYDYGDVAFEDTMDTLRAAGIAYIGAGMNEAEAYAPYYVEQNGVKIAFCAASRAERSFYKSRIAEGDKLGLAGIFDADRFLAEIREADASADIVIVYAHWGEEYNKSFTSVQTNLAHQFIDAGADIVLGAHPHILQGMEIYDGKPIIYSLGNFWFNMKSLDTALLRVVFSGDGFDIFIVPAKQEKGVTAEIVDEQKRRELFDYLESLSPNVAIADDGRIYLK